MSGRKPAATRDYSFHGKINHIHRQNNIHCPKATLKNLNHNINNHNKNPAVLAIKDNIIWYEKPYSFNIIMTIQPSLSI